MLCYELQHGDVWVRDAHGAGRHICRGSERMAVAFDAEWGVLHKHGASRDVHRWADEKRAAWERMGMSQRATSIVVIEFAPVPAVIDELNACIRTSSRILQFEAFLQSFAAAHPQIDVPSYPEP